MKKMFLPAMMSSNNIEVGKMKKRFAVLSLCCFIVSSAFAAPGGSKETKSQTRTESTTRSTQSQTSTSTSTSQSSIVEVTNAPLKNLYVNINPITCSVAIVDAAMKYALGKLQKDERYMHYIRLMNEGKVEFSGPETYVRYLVNNASLFNKDFIAVYLTGLEKCANIKVETISGKAIDGEKVASFDGLKILFNNGWMIEMTGISDATGNFSGNATVYTDTGVVSFKASYGVISETVSLRDTRTIQQTTEKGIIEIRTKEKSIENKTNTEVRSQTTK